MPPPYGAYTPAPFQKPKPAFYKRPWFVVLAVLFGIGAIGSALSPPEEDEDSVEQATSFEREDEETTTTEAEEEVSEETTTTEAPTTTVDPAVLAAERQARLDTAAFVACGEAVAAPITTPTADAVNSAVSSNYVGVNDVIDRQGFTDLVFGCAAQQRIDRVNNECGGDAPVELMNRDPDQFLGQCFTLTFAIVQFDQGTGPCAFRAYFDNGSHEWNFEYLGENGFVAFDEPCPQLNAIGTDDVVRLRVASLGGLDYTTTLGGETSAAAFQALGDPEVLQNN